MKINPTTVNIPFLKKIRIKIKDKTIVPSRPDRGKSKMARIMEIASKNNASIFVGEDVILSKANQELKNELDKAKIKYEEIEDTEGDCKEC